MLDKPYIYGKIGGVGLGGSQNNTNKILDVLKYHGTIDDIRDRTLKEKQMITKNKEITVAMCRVCGTNIELLVDPLDFEAWQEGKYIQDAMPYLSAGERELLISGTCDDCWGKMFGESC